MDRDGVGKQCSLRLIFGNLATKQQTIQQKTIQFISYFNSPNSIFNYFLMNKGRGVEFDEDAHGYEERQRLRIADSIRRREDPI